MKLNCSCLTAALLAVLCFKPVGLHGAEYDAIVATDGSGAYTNIQAAVEAAPENGTRPFFILIKPGVYHEHVVVDSNRPFVKLVGQPGAAERTVITGGLNFKTPGPKGRTVNARESSTVLVQAPNFTAENITFENSTTHEDHVQALAMYVEADRARFRNCRFLGWQDTLRADAPRSGIGRQYFDHCYIEGHVDFIYAAGTAVFDHCRIHVKSDGYITAASTPADRPFGYVFLDCKVTAGPGVERGFYLGRPWRPYAAVTFLRCEMPGPLRPAGWDNWRDPENEKTARYAEYGSTGPGANPAGRVKWAKQLTRSEADKITVKAVLAGDDGWNPTR